jgi:alcohol dehydrogenase, propanol-preferring
MRVEKAGDLLGLLGSEDWVTLVCFPSPAAGFLAVIDGFYIQAVQFAKAIGYNVVAIDVRPAPLELCKSLPEHLQPDLFLNPDEMTVQEMLESIEKTFGEAVYTPTSQRPGDANSTQREPTTLPATGLDAVLVCTDSVRGYATGIELLAKHGILVYVGQPEKPVPMHWSAFVTRDITVVAGCLPCGRWSGVRLGGGLGLNGRGSRMGAGLHEQGRWMSARDVMGDMVELVEKVGLHVEVSEYLLEDVGRMLTEFGGDGVKGKLVLRVEND